MFGIPHKIIIHKNNFSISTIKTRRKKKEESNEEKNDDSKINEKKRWNKTGRKIKRII